MAASVVAAAPITLAFLLLFLARSASGVSEHSKRTRLDKANAFFDLASKKKSRGGTCSATQSERLAWKCSEIAVLNVDAGPPAPEWTSGEFASFCDASIKKDFKNEWRQRTDTRDISIIEVLDKNECTSGKGQKTVVHFKCMDTKNDVGQGTYAAWQEHVHCEHPARVDEREVNWIGKVLGEWPKWCATDGKQVTVNNHALLPGMCVHLVLEQTSYTIPLAELSEDVTGTAEPSALQRSNQFLNKNEAWWSAMAWHLQGALIAAGHILAVYHFDQLKAAFWEKIDVALVPFVRGMITALGVVYETFTKVKKGLKILKEMAELALEELRLKDVDPAYIMQGLKAAAAGKPVEVITKFFTAFGILIPQVEACLCCKREGPFTTKQRLNEYCRIAYTFGATKDDPALTGIMKATAGGIYALGSGALGLISKLTYGIWNERDGVDHLTPLEPLAEHVPSFAKKSACWWACRYRSEEDHDYAHYHVQMIPGTSLNIPYFSSKDLMQTTLTDLVTEYQANVGELTE